jgi:hypothetical protein
VYVPKYNTMWWNVTDTALSRKSIYVVNITTLTVANILAATGQPVLNALAYVYVYTTTKTGGQIVALHEDSGEVAVPVTQTTGRLGRTVLAASVGWDYQTPSRPMLLVAGVNGLLAVSAVTLEAIAINSGWPAAVSAVIPSADARTAYCVRANDFRGGIDVYTLDPPASHPDDADGGVSSIRLGSSAASATSYSLNATRFLDSGGNNVNALALDTGRRVGYAGCICAGVWCKCVFRVAWYLVLLLIYVVAVITWELSAGA